MYEDYVGVSYSSEGVSLAVVTDRIGEPRLETSSFRACAPEDRQSVLESMVSDMGLEDAYTVAILQPADYELFLVDALEFTDKDKVPVLNERVSEYLDYPVEQAVVEYIPLPNSEEAQREMAYIIAVQKSTVDDMVGQLKSAGLNVRAVDIAELAIRNLAKNLPETQEGGLVLYLEPEQSQLLMMRDGKVCMMRRIDIDAKPFFMKEDDENRPDMTMFQEIFADSIAAEVGRSVSYAETQLGQPAPKQLLVSPMGGGIQDFFPSIESKVGIPLRMMALDEILDLDDDLLPEHQQRCLFAVGAALREEIGE